jgi:serine O-acetyltransferase
MIQTKEDYIFYLESDRLSLGIKEKTPPFFGKEIWKFERLLRKLEFYMNCKNGLFWDFYIYFLQWKFHRISVKLGFSIPVNVFGPGLSIAHRGTIVVMGSTKVGANCRIHTCVNIGVQAGPSNLAPQIGENVYIGPGAKLFGDIRIADGIAIGANAVVNKSFLEPGITIAGVPAKKISDKGSEGLLSRGTEMIEEK